MVCSPPSHLLWCTYIGSCHHARLLMLRTVDATTLSARSSSLRAHSAPPAETTAFSHFRTSDFRTSDFRAPGLPVRCSIRRRALTFSSLHFPPRPAEPVLQHFSGPVANTLSSLAPSAFLFPLSGRIFPLLTLTVSVQARAPNPSEECRATEKICFSVNAEKQITDEASYCLSPIS